MFQPLVGGLVIHVPSSHLEDAYLQDLSRYSISLCTVFPQQQVIMADTHVALL